MIWDRVSGHAGAMQVVQHHLQPRQGEEDTWGSSAGPGKVGPRQLGGPGSREEQGALVCSCR